MGPARHDTQSVGRTNRRGWGVTLGTVVAAVALVAAAVVVTARPEPAQAADPNLPVPPTCAWGSTRNDCQKISPEVNVTLSATSIASGGTSTMTVTPTLPACKPYYSPDPPKRDCYEPSWVYMGAGSGILPPYQPGDPTFGYATLEYGVDGTICYQYVAVCTFKVTYNGELPSRWIVVTGAAMIHSAAPPPDGIEFSTISTSEGPAYQWFAGTNALLRITGSNTPNAAFSVAPTADPATLRFTSSSSDPGGGPLTHQWSFGDGKSATGNVVEHTYAKPGDYDIGLKVTNTGGTSASTSKKATIKAPTLDVAISLPDGSSTLEPGDTSPVRVKVSASADGVGSLTELSVTKALTSSDAEKVAITKALAPTGTFDLAPGASKTLTGEIEAAKTGTADLTTTVAGKDAAGRGVTKQGTKTIKVRSSVLSLDLSLSKDDVTLDEDAKGPRPQTLDLTVKATNTSDKPVTDVKLLSIIPSWQEGLPFTAVFPKAVVQATNGPGAAGLGLGTIAPGAAVSKTFKVQVKDDGHVRLGTDATYVDGDGTNGFATGEVKLLSRPKFLLRFDAEADASIDDNAADPWNPPDAVGAERPFLVTGSLKNLTTDQRIIATVPATGLKQVSSPELGKLEEDWDEPSTPFRVQLDAQDSQGVHASPKAIPVPAKNGVLTFAELGYAPTGKAELHDDDAELTKIKPEQVLTTDEQRFFKVPIAWAPPQPAPTPIEFYGLFTKAFIESTAAWWADAARAAGSALYAVGEIEAQAWNVLTDPVAREAFRIRMVGAWASFVETMDLLRATILSLTPAQKAELVATITNPLLAFLQAGRAITTSAQAQAAAKAIGGAISTVWTRITTLGGEDPRELARLLGSGSATVFNEVTIGMVTDAAIAKLIGKLRYAPNLAKAEEFVNDAAKAKAAEGLRIDKGLKGIPEGAALTDEVLTIGLGITKAEKAQIQRVAKRFNLRVMARSRGAEAAELIKKGMARLKPFGIDAKNVNDIDRLLGFPKSLKDTVAIKKPLAWEKVVASGEYRALDAEQKAQVAARWQTRSKEWNGAGKLKEASPGEWVVSENPGTGIGAERKKFEEAAKAKTFDLQFPTKGNWEEVAVDGKALGTAKADFKLKRFVDEAGDEILQPLMSDVAGGTPLPITGDVDLVALLNPNGTYPDPRKIIEAYAELAKPPLRMQHPATWSFNVDGKSMDLLRDHVLGGATAEPLAAFEPGGQITAVLFNPKTSLIPADRAANPALFINVAGGIKLPSHAYGLGALGPAIIETSKQTTPYYVPEQWAEAQGRVPATKARPRTDRTTAGVWFIRGAAPVEEGTGRDLVRFTSATWSTWTPPPTGPLVIAPQTCITDALAEGTRSIGVYSLSKLFEQGGSGGQQWFAVGDEITVDLHGDHPWTTRVAKISATSVTFTDPSPRAYLAGTAVHLSEATTDGSNSGSGSGEAGVTDAGTNPGTDGTGSAPESLARTGTDLVEWGAVAGALIVVGLAMTLTARRRRRAATDPA